MNSIEYEDDDRNNRINAARAQWGIVFNAFNLACERVNIAWNRAEDKQVLKQENDQRLHSLIKYAQKELEKWERRSKSA